MLPHEMRLSRKNKTKRTIWGIPILHCGTGLGRVKFSEWLRKYQWNPSTHLLLGGETTWSRKSGKNRGKKKENVTQEECKQHKNVHLFSFSSCTQRILTLVRGYLIKKHFQLTRECCFLSWPFIIPAGFTASLFLALFPPPGMNLGEFLFHFLHASASFQ